MAILLRILPVTINLSTCCGLMDANIDDICFLS